MKNNTVPHTQVTRADHTIKACLEGKTDRPLALSGAVIPRGDYQSTRGMDLSVVSQLRFLGPVPFHTTTFPGQFLLLSCLYGPASSAASTGQLPLWSSLQFYGVGALSPVLRG